MVSKQNPAKVAQALTGYKEVIHAKYRNGAGPRLVMVPTGLTLALPNTKTLPNSYLGCMAYL